MTARRFLDLLARFRYESSRVRESRADIETELQGASIHDSRGDDFGPARH